MSLACLVPRRHRRHLGAPADRRRRAWNIVKSAANPTAPNWRPGSTTLSYNANGHLRSSYDSAANLRSTYFTNANGLVMKRERTQGSQNTKVGSHYYYYYADGRRIGDVSDDPSDNPRVSYAEQLAAKRVEPADRKTLYKTFKPVSSADFDQNYEPINESYPAATASSYTVRGTEDLQAIAQSLWGDRAMWYLIAEANGLRGDEGLAPGQVLVIPNKVTNIHNNAQTFRPYSAGEAIGRIDPTLPTAPPPPTQQGGKGCGALGTVIMVVIAVVVTYYSGGLASSAMGDATAAGTAAAAGMAATVSAGQVHGRPHWGHHQRVRLRQHWKPQLRRPLPAFDRRQQRQLPKLPPSPKTS